VYRNTVTLNLPLTPTAIKVFSFKPANSPITGHFTGTSIGGKPFLEVLYAVGVSPGSSCGIAKSLKIFLEKLNSLDWRWPLSGMLYLNVNYVAMHGHSPFFWVQPQCKRRSAYSYVKRRGIETKSWQPHPSGKDGGRPHAYSA
jgi:hypothetical protein